MWDWSWGPEAQLAPAGTLPPSRLSEHKTQPLLPVTLRSSFPGPTPTLCARGSQAQAAWNPSLPRLAGNGRRGREVSHADTTPTHVPPRKHFPERLSTSRPGAHTCWSSHTQRVSTEAFREPRHPQTLADSQALYVAPLTTQLTSPDTEALR